MSHKKYFSETVCEESKRCEVLGRFIEETGSTVREAANKYGISKSTVHKDVTERLRIENRALYEKVRKVLTKNKAERHLRGGNATKQKYIEKRLSRS